LTKLLLFLMLPCIFLLTACSPGNGLVSNMQSVPTISSALLPDDSPKNDPASGLVNQPSNDLSTAGQLVDGATPAAWISPTSIIIKVKTPTIVVISLPTEPVSTDTPFPQKEAASTQTTDRTWDAGDIRKSPLDGALVVYIPAGKFLQGSSGSDQDAQTNEKPQRSVTINGFWIDLNKVTNGMYHRCELDMGCKAPNKNNWPVLGDAKGYYNNPAFDDYPVVNVTWSQAKDYCTWAGRRLPTEAEWEKAARGTDGRIYPWGDQKPNDQLLNYANNLTHTNRVGLYPDGTSPYGVLEMAGNTLEWVSDMYDEIYYAYAPLNNPIGPTKSGIDMRVIRGVSWKLDESHARAASRQGKWILNFDEQTGFRCAADNALFVESITKSLLEYFWAFLPPILPIENRLVNS
jgi:formylglycine-generating enzyme required for sulfatase activity